MGQKIYDAHDDGTIEFQSGRKAWNVDIPAYVYDLWLPLIGATAVGVYGVYCRLEREGEIYGMKMKSIAIACRIGTDKLRETNEILEDCGFIQIVKPEGWQRRAHFTVKIVTLDAPSIVAPAHIEKYGVKNSKTWAYQPLSHWLVEQNDSKTQVGSPQKPTWVAEENPDRYANIESSVVESSQVAIGRAASKSNPPSAAVEEDEFARFDLAVLTPKKNQLEKGKVISPADDIFDHPLVKLFREATGLRTLTNELRKAFVDDIKYPTQDGAKATLRGGLIALWDTLPGFENFCRQRIPEMLAWDHVLSDVNMLKHLRNVNKQDGVGGFFLWRDKHPDLCRQEDPVRDAKEAEAQRQRDLASSDQLAQLWGD